MTPADKEVLAILRRVLIAPDWWTEIERIEKEIEPCSGSDSQSERSQPSQPVLESSLGTPTSTRRGEVDPCNPTPIHCAVCGAEMSVLETEIGHRCKNQTSETSGAPTGTPARPVGTATIVPTTTSLPTDNPPDLDAIRKAWNRLRDAREGYLRSERRCEDVRPIGEAVAALLALDVPAVVAALMDEAKGERYVAGCERADRLDAEARVKELETRTAEDHDAICRQAQRLADAVRRYEFANARAEAAEALADLAELVRHDTERKLTAMQQERDEARAEKAEALEREHEQARKA